MALRELHIEGLRGFNRNQSLTFSIPNGAEGSGLTILTGANNSGKSTVVEALRARSGSGKPSFTVGSRNRHTDSVRIVYKINGVTEIIQSITKGGSETKTQNADRGFQIFVLPSRRSFNPFFGKGHHTREQYLNSYGLPPLRTTTLSGFENRLFNILENPIEFNKVLRKVLPFEPDWTIDQSDQGQYYLKFNFGGSTHTSDGMGDGIISIFSIVDSLYDSKPGDVIVVDEPELSLHPSLQKRLMSLLAEYGKDRQILISTHSPYFVDINSIINGAHIIRVRNDGSGINVYQLGNTSTQYIKELSLGNIYNPHTFGLTARELFFLEDRVILAEGQEDVLLYPQIAEQLSISLSGDFFGWGVGGAQNMPKLCFILKELGFTKGSRVCWMATSKLRSRLYRNNFQAISSRTSPPTT